MLLKEGYTFRSETDSEVACNLIAYCLKTRGGSLLDAVQAALDQIEGSYAFVVLCQDDPNTIVAAKKSSPMIFGYGDGCNFVASDVTAVLRYTREVVYLNDDELVEMTADSVHFYDRKGNELEKTPEHIDWELSAAEKNGYDHFMIKEIQRAAQGAGKHHFPQNSRRKNRSGRYYPGSGLHQKALSGVCGCLRQRILCRLRWKVCDGEAVPDSGGADVGVRVPLLRSAVR